MKSTKIARFLFGILLILVTYGHANKNKEIIQNQALTDLTIIVSSCDKYHDCWQPFCQLLFKYWPSLKTYNKTIPIILITNQKDFSYEGTIVYKTGKDRSWSDNLLEVLKTVKTKYVLYLQEDYFLSASIDTKRLAYLLNKMKEKNIDYIEISPDGFFNKEKLYPFVKGTVIKSKHIPYRTSLQAALWDKEVLEWLVKPKETAWDFELKGSIRSEGNMHPFLAAQENHPFHYVNACGAGYFTSYALDFLKKEGIPLNNISLPLDKDYPFTLWLREFSQKSCIRKLRLYTLWTKILGLWDPKFS